MADPNCFLNLALFCGLCLLRVFAQEEVDTHPVQDVFVAEGNDVQFPALGPLDGPEVNVVLCDVHHGATNTMLLNYYRGSPVELTSRFVNRSGLSWRTESFAYTRSASVTKPSTVFESTWEQGSSTGCTCSMGVRTLYTHGFTLSPLSWFGCVLSCAAVWKLETLKMH
ncbi:uncharacterized protein LOC103189479 isoform X2 [Callorhinchus milii]|uniref:uncharacterized protein LOC103189479 isoform X2 n=1 Tax=Callorhinchus milii TaxID=7868 RepID=UPI001C3FC6C9|nr:uncharacterized protein LOC103189479 isoform X2 [Callorhinchus milii]